MRMIAAIAFVFLGVALMAAPASAHRAAHAPDQTSISNDASAPDSAPAGLCLFSINGERTKKQPPKENAERPDADHGAGDHSHPIGEDTFHQKSSHASADAAHDQDEATLDGIPPAALTTPSANERICGIEVAPPIRPPLG